MERIIDLSGALKSGMWGYYSLPGLENTIPHVTVEPIATVEKDEFFASRITFSSISGTYLEAASHIVEGGRNLDEHKIEDFIKPAKLIRIPYVEGKDEITREMLLKHAPKIETGDALIIDTGWWRYWNQPGYVSDSPSYSHDALQWVIDQKISILCVDITCIEAAWNDDELAGEKGGLLGALFGSGALLAAPLVNLGVVKGPVGRIYCLPLSVEGTSGAPARIVYIEEE